MTLPKPPSRSSTCSDCGNDIPVSRTNCPHCGRPSLFPNVVLASDAVEKAKLQDRYNVALAACASQGCEELALDFVAECKLTRAVFAWNISRLVRELGTETDVFETYYDLERLRLRTESPSGLDWSRLRPQAEIELLGSHHHLDQLHYACLSMDGNGLDSYGECFVSLSDSMIGHRASCFEGNSAVVFAREHTFANHVRSVWTDRHMICLAALSTAITSATAFSDFPAIILGNGISPEEDKFIEVHIFGPITRRTIGSIRIDSTKFGRREALLCKILQEKLAGIRIDLVKP